MAENGVPDRGTKIYKNITFTNTNGVDITNEVQNTLATLLMKS